MIAASEPLEFVPHGRTVLANHPGKIYNNGHNVSASENSLLYKLTNFGIKDDSILETKDEDNEWWTIRKVYYKATEVDDDESKFSKDSKLENESFRPPSRLKHDFNISIKSELMSGLKKDDLSGTSKGGSANSSSNMCKKFNLNCAQNKQNKGLNPKTDSYYEEELYVKGCTAIWSKGLISSPGSKVTAPEQRETIACYTIENPIKHAAFADFHVDIKNTMLIDALNSQIGDSKKNIKIEDSTEHLQSETMPSILLIDNKCMRVFAVDGREYVTSLPFQVKKVWPMKYGVLLEKDATPLLNNSIFPISLLKHNESHYSTFSKSKISLQHLSAKLRAESISGYDHECPLPTCFSLSHPLDEVTPILMKSPSQGLQYYNDGDLQIIFVASNPSIILLYDWKLGTHSLWKIRKAIRDECLSMCSNMNSTSFNQSCDFRSPTHSMKSWGSPLHSKKQATPVSRQNSSMANIFHQQGMSPHASIGQASSPSMANTMIQNPPSLPLYPDVCIEHIYTDNQSLRRDPIEQPNDVKAFLHTDLVGHEYLCYMVKVDGLSKLQIMRLKRSHSHGQTSKTNIIVGWMSSVVAKDAVVLDHLKMIALVDETGNIVLQSGNDLVGKVHVGGVLARLIDSPYTKRSTFQSPFPRRSSLLPTRCDTTFDDSALHLLSPVPHSSVSRLEHNKETLGIRGVCDAAGDRLSVRFESGQLYRIALPPHSQAPLLQRTCSALASALPKDITMQVLIKWYGVRNAPGTQDLTPEQEWEMFSNLILSLIGYDIDKHKSLDEDPEIMPKKQRTSNDGSQDDWDYVIHSKFHKNMNNTLTNVLNLKALEVDSKKKVEEEKSIQFNSNALLFPYTVHLFYTFHLLYEDLKLNTLLENDLRVVSKFLYQIAKDICLDKYVDHYWLDFPTHFAFAGESQSQIPQDVRKKLVQPNYFCVDPPNIFAYLNSVLKDVDEGCFPYISQVNDTSKDIIEILSSAGCGRGAGVRTLCVAGGEAPGLTTSTPRAGSTSTHSSPHAAAVMLACERGFTPRELDKLPPALSLILITIFNRCKAEPPTDWPPAAYRLAMREDLAIQAGIKEKISSTDDYLETLALEVLEKDTAFTQKDTYLDDVSSKSDEDITGMEHLNTELLKMLYPDDRRMTEVYNLLQSSKPVTINLTQRPEVSDHDFIEEQEKYLYAIGTRTMALPIGRGMVTLRTLACPPTDSLTLPKLCVSGRGPPPRCNTINLSANDTSPHCLLWPTFHNGVAAGLALVPMTGSSIDANWVIYNKQRGTQDMSTEHAGFLLALGLNGHLKDMPYMTMYEYLIKCHEMISIGLLLGLAATFRGTMDVQATKMLSIHVEALLPPSSVELDIQHGILVAALLGVGLLYQRTAHAHYAQVLLREIGKPPGPEMENCVEREGYALAAGLALGCVCLKAGDSPQLGDLAPALRTYMLGGDRRGFNGSQKEKYKQGSFAIREGSTVNLDVTSPGATLALGLIYMQTNNAAVAEWLEPPTTAYMLDFVRPDLLMLRIIARGLVLWDSISPTEDWVEDQVPDTIRPYCFVKPTEANIDYEAMNQAYCNIVAGACFALGLRFAGSGNEVAKETVLYYANRLASPPRRLPDLAGAATLETCCCVCLLAAGCIMAGRGDLEVLRLCRRLRARTAASRGPAPSRPKAHAPLTHGAQMAVHMTLGLLFLGGGRATLASTPEAVAALLIAFFPKFPTHTEDNRYHLQAFRHLYVLAVENRLVLPRDIDSGSLCYAFIQVIDVDNYLREYKAPCIIPELNQLKVVKIDDTRYWPILFERDRNWDQLKTFLEYTWCIDIKQRAGCLPYSKDPEGFTTMLGHTLTLDQTNIWSAKPDNIDLFSNDEQVRGFIRHYLAQDEADVGTNICGDCLVLKKKRGVKEMNRTCVCRKYSKEEQEFIQSLSVVTYECVVKDVLRALPIWTSFLKIIKLMRTEPSSYHMWQIKLLLAQVESLSRRSSDEMDVDDNENEPLISTEFTLAVKQKIALVFDKWELKILPFLRKYLGMPSSRSINGCHDDIKRILASFLVYHELRRNLLGESGFDTSELGLVMCEKASLSGVAACKVLELVR
ncbi:anaphase-promoting complex subunit 1 [Pieris rapae]|uniref:anaphase-promoting complex subunit 1 n=1 Tax=Pieris rapae TaxID=64459 RepID=UPI001E27ED92|nr:anaphase-promoting complex subunit 1 [Pieris rapae]